MPACIDTLKAIVGGDAVLTDPQVMALYLSERRGSYQGRAAAVVLPGSTDETAAVVARCDRREIVLGLARMNRVRDLDVEDDTITLEAGCLLAEVQRAAARLLPSLSA